MGGGGSKTTTAPVALCKQAKTVTLQAIDCAEAAMRLGAADQRLCCTALNNIDLVRGAICCPEQPGYCDTPTGRALLSLADTSIRILQNPSAIPTYLAEPASGQLKIARTVVSSWEPGTELRSSNLQGIFGFFQQAFAQPQALPTTAPSVGFASLPAPPPLTSVAAVAAPLAATAALSKSGLRMPAPSRPLACFGGKTAVFDDATKAAYTKIWKTPEGNDIAMVQVHFDPLGNAAAYCYSKAQLESWFAQPNVQARDWVADSSGAYRSGQQTFYRLPNDRWIDEASKKLLLEPKLVVFDASQKGQTKLNNSSQPQVFYYKGPEGDTSSKSKDAVPDVIFALTPRYE